MNMSGKVNAAMSGKASKGRYREGSVKRGRMAAATAAEGSAGGLQQCLLGRA